MWFRLKLQSISNKRYLKTVALAAILLAPSSSYAKLIRYKINRLGTEQELIHFCWEREAGHHQVVNSGGDSERGFFVVCGDPGDLSGSPTYSDILTRDVAFINDQIHEVAELTSLSSHCQTETPQTIREVADIPEAERGPSEPFKYAVNRKWYNYTSIFSFGILQVGLEKYVQSLGRRPITWIDSGAGNGYAQQDYILTQHPPEGSELVAFAKFLPKDPTNLLLKVHETRVENKIKYRFFAQPTEKEFLFPLKGKVDLITDLYGAFSYSPQISKVLTFFGNYLKPGGRAYIAAQKDVIHFITGEGKALELEEFLKTRVKGFEVLKYGSDHYLLERNGEPLEVPETSRIYADIDRSPFHQVYRINEPGSENYVYDTSRLGWDSNSIIPLDKMRANVDPNYRIEEQVKETESKIAELKNDIRKSERDPDLYLQFMKRQLTVLEETLEKHKAKLNEFLQKKAAGTYRDLPLQKTMDITQFYKGKAPDYGQPVLQVNHEFE